MKSCNVECFLRWMRDLSDCSHCNQACIDMDGAPVRLQSYPRWEGGGIICPPKLTRQREGGRDRERQRERETRQVVFS